MRHSPWAANSGGFQLPHDITKSVFDCDIQRSFASVAAYFGISTKGQEKFDSGGMVRPRGDMQGGKTLIAAQVHICARYGTMAA
ncbi:hypothetical protein OO012_18510 [Rhodobacteraceae bacterium KMM 6894]|nr:hypothetical protein [Rhodobacteraceae bacterium KMM 6894]